MAVSCPEVMYGAYYPYLYGRGAARYHHHAHFQYDRFNVQSGGGGGGEAYGAGGALSSGSASSPGSPGVRLRAKEEHGRASADNTCGGSSESEGECAPPQAARAQYVSANCVVFTHYSGDVAAVVDEHFTRALAVDKHKESVPMVSRNLPASFFNALAGGGAGGGGAGGAGGACGVELYEYDPWAQHYGGYGVGGGQYAAGYGPLLLGRSVHAQYKPVDWHQHHHLDPAACAPYPYPAVPGFYSNQTEYQKKHLDEAFSKRQGLEAPVQDSSKDLYWF